ncbi:MAG: hypothetical protein JSV88_09655 [Candidatus Aminicenantes bacterium]|nr:MAG: hypothetical protein JSV88_09655 [Candidatus Aminicenantes bacterium]
MVSEKTIINSFDWVTAESYGARFYRADLHFHTPASEDARTKKEIHNRKRDTYTWKLYDEVFPGKNNNLEEYYKKVREKQEEIERKSKELAGKMVERFVAEKIRLVAVTDHNGIGTIWNDPEADKKIMDLAAPTWYELIDDKAREVNKKEGKTLLTILPGVEISTTGVHILAVFPPQVPRREIHFIICDLLNDVGFDIKEWGKNPKLGKASIYNTIELIAAKGGIPIIAHADGSDQAILKL